MQNKAYTTQTQNSKTSCACYDGVLSIQLLNLNEFSSSEN